MDKTGSTLIVVAVIVLALSLMVLGWRALQKRQAKFPAPETVPDDTAKAGTPILSVEALYVATTLADQELQRIAVSGLGFRSRSSVTVTDAGIILALDGVPEIFISRTRIRSIDRATYTIDRVVEKGGLVRLCWTLGEATAAVDVDSYLRVQEPARTTELLNAVLALVPPGVIAAAIPPSERTTPGPKFPESSLAEPTEGHTP